MNDDEDLWLNHSGITRQQAIIELKESLLKQHGAQKIKQHLIDASDIVKRQLDELHSDKHTPILDIDYQDIIQDKIDDEMKKLVHKRGVVIVRNVFNQSQIKSWNEEISSYIDDNDYLGKAEAKKGLDQYFSNLGQSQPQIYSLYWSKPQIAMRQSEELAKVRQFLNHLWFNYDGVFDPNQECSYADRIRRRAPGDASLGLSPHMDGGTIERWLNAGYRSLYASVFAGNFADYHPFDASQRTKTEEVQSPAICRMFRTYQGWTALSSQGPNDGTLTFVPITNAIIYILWRALQDDVAKDDLCQAMPGRALTISKDFHHLLLQGLMSVPKVDAGDSVWWHPDIIHGVEQDHLGCGYSNVTYIGAAPHCPKNQHFLQLQKQAFLDGLSSPDFAPEHYEIDFKNRATMDDLSPLGKIQMGF